VARHDSGAAALRVTRTFAASRERVFRAFIDPKAVRVWFAAPSYLSWTEPPAIDPRPGGLYRFTVQGRGRVWCIHGAYVEVKAPERLVFTWLWENDPERGDSGDTLVTVEFHDRGGRTEVVLTHERLAAGVVHDQHATGWAECLEAIAKLLEEADPVPRASPSP
jgi:uncharacterized protein YndB with AHSA1/START domain